MHTHLIEHYQSKKSPIHSLDGRIKVLYAFAFILSCTLLPNAAWAAYIFLTCILICLILIADLSLQYVLKRSLFVLPFILAAFPLIFRDSEHLLAIFTIGKYDIKLSLDGLIRFVSIGVKSWLSVMAATLLASTTSFPSLLIALRAVKIPRLLVAIVGLMWRYLSLMVDEMERLTRARLSRSSQKNMLPGNPVGNRWTWRARTTGGMAGSLLIRSLERSERVYQAMLSRGYDGDIRAGEIPPLGSRTIIGLAMASIVLLFVVLLSHLSTGA